MFCYLCTVGVIRLLCVLNINDLIINNILTYEAECCTVPLLYYATAVLCCDSNMDHDFFIKTCSQVWILECYHR